MDTVTKRRLELDGLIAEVSNDGEGAPPWYEGGTVYRYRVMVTAPEGEYTTRAWGSMHDRERANDQDHESIGYMVLGELLSAAYDPDEFWELAEPKNREQANRVGDLIDAAKALLPALERNSDAINKHA